MALADELIGGFDRALRAIAGVHQGTRPSPGDTIRDEAALSEAQRAHAAALMRVNHVGEICAQALYEGQAIAARSPETRAALARAAEEERDHLAWCAGRIRQLGGRASVLNPLWYAGSFLLGAGASALGDRWNLAFLAETERQVEQHLTAHLAQLAPKDGKTRSIVEAMREDEARHRQTAVVLGAAELPLPVKAAMRVMSKVMTTVSYRI
jgi:ubiquinone biosynthesis monooxygenase Coq7